MKTGNLVDFIVRGFINRHTINKEQHINYLRNKFKFLVEFIRGKVDILMISETKIDESFPLGQFKVLRF